MEEVVRAKMGRPSVIAMAGVGLSVIFLAVGGYYAYKSFGSGGAAADASSGDGLSIVAVVNDQQIPKAEISILVASGMNPAVARDAAIQRAVLAIAADRYFPEDASLAVQSVAREAKAQVYLTKETEVLTKAVTDEDIRKWYETNLLAEDFRQLKLRFYQSASIEDAQAVAAAANQGDSRAIAKFAPLTKEASGFVSVADVPYGLGRNLSKQKEGVYGVPVMARTGALSFVLDESKTKERPALADVKDNIRQVIVRTKLGEVIGELRATMKVELKG